MLQSIKTFCLINKANFSLKTKKEKKYKFKNLKKKKNKVPE